MATTIFPAPTASAFSSYKPSVNAHLDVLQSGNATASSSSSKGVKVIKLNIKPRRPEASSSDRLSTLLTSIPQLLSGQPTTTSYHALSATCHKLVLLPHALGPTIYTRVKEELEKSVSGMAREWRGFIMGRGQDWLDHLTSGWRMWEARVKLLSAVFVYLDRVYSNDSTGIASIQELAVATFRKGIWENEVLFQKTRDEVLSWAASERSSATPAKNSRSTVSAVRILAKLLNSFPTLTVPYLESTNAHYVSQANKNTDQVESGGMSPTKYVQWVLDKVFEEAERALECLDENVAHSAVSIIRDECGSKMSGKIVRRALDEAMDLVDAPALGRLYRFSVDVEVFSVFSRSLQEYIEARLKKLISDPANDPRMIEETVKLKRFTDKSIRGLFIAPAATIASDQQGKDTASQTTVDGEGVNGTAADAEDKHGVQNGDEAEMEQPSSEVELSAVDRTRYLDLQDSIRAGFKAGMGSRQNAPAEWIAKHLDQVMRRGQGSGTEAAFNGLLDEIIALIGFTRDKDVFKAFYSTQLAKRLLLNKSASDDMERNMIIKLQNEMGEEFTSGDVMMKDLQLSENMVKAYQSHLSKTPDASDPTNLTANVLTESAWPAYPQLKTGWSFKLTPELQKSVDEFTKWYSTQHKNRQLSWRWQLATVSLTGRFPSGRYEIGVSLFQAVVLLQFNEDEVLDFKEIQIRTGIENSELMRTLQSLSLGRPGTRVLHKKPMSKLVSPTDQFNWNRDFKSDRIKFRINQIQQDMTAEESQKTNEQVAVDRVSVLEATIVRIMKGKKKLTLTLLIDNVVTDVSKRFPPDVREIKKRVESLIEREFLMRDDEDRNLLHYLA